jgi:hypothetical protein
MASCPWVAKLESAGTGAVADASFAAIEQHVENCPDCQSALEWIAHGRFDRLLVLPSPERLPRIPGFELVRELGRGGMGVVYLAIEIGLGRQVALKILPGAIGTDALPLARRRWLREALAVSSIRHPNAVPLYDFGEADGWLFLVFEYVPSGSLKNRLAGPLPARAAAGLVETIARAVAFIHGRGLLHLDLKPSNILPDCEANAPWDRVIPRVSDFGLALFDDHDDSVTSLAGPRGTPSYMAPEQTAPARATIGVAADVHALGAILFELLTGRPPFQGKSTIETLEQVRCHEPVPPRRLNPAIPRDLETVCLKCLEKDPGRRYHSAEALAEDLRRWLDGHAVLARPVSPVEITWRWCCRRPVVATLAASLLTTLLCGFASIVALWRYADAERIQALAERTRAEADYAVARAAVAEILDLGQTSIEPTVTVSRDRAIASLQVAQRRIQKLGDRRPSDPELWNLLAVVKLFLGRNYEYQRRFVEGEALYVESQRGWEKILEKTPGDLTALYRHWQTLECLARIREEQGRTADSTSSWERAIAAGEALLPKLSAPDLNTMAECRSGLARLLDRQGDHERAVRLHLANLQMLSSAPPRPRTASVERWLVQTWDELARIRCEAARFDDQSWVRDAAALLRAGPGRKDGGAAELSGSGLRLQDSVYCTASAQRRAGHHQEARRNVKRMHALGRLLVLACPDCPDGHLALSLAFQQSAKEAFQSEDLAAVRQSWSRGLEEAQRAVLLDPQNTLPKWHVSQLGHKLERLLGGR